MFKACSFRFAVLLLALALAGKSQSSDRIYSDLSEESPDRRYQASATSPDNQGDGFKVFQSNFTYALKDTKDQKQLWTRKQGKEGSPKQLFVSDAGWTVIRGSWDDLVVVDKQGTEHGRVDLLTDAFTKEESEKYVRQTTVGPMWSGHSLWYFLSVGEQHLFVLRPWWGRRAVVDLETGKLATETAAIAKGISAHERQFVLAEIAKGIDALKKGDPKDCGDNPWDLRTAAYLAGVLPVPDAVPALEKLQESTYSGSFTMRMTSDEKTEGKVYPHDYRTFTLRQTIQLSLRRLGKKPSPLPATQLDVQRKADEKSHPYQGKALDGPRHAHAGQVKKGMEAEEVLDLLGAPDFIGNDAWEYDMDADEPFSLIIHWDKCKVKDVERKKPLWKEGTVRDEQVVGH